MCILIADNLVNVFKLLQLNKAPKLNVSPHTEFANFNIFV